MLDEKADPSVVGDGTRRCEGDGDTLDHSPTHPTTEDIGREDTTLIHHQLERRT